MRILFDFQNMIGGAPRSQLAHMMAMRECGHDVIATISDDCDVLREQAPGVQVFELPGFDARRLVSSIVSIVRWVRFVETVKPDIIHANRIMHSKFLAIVSDLTGVPLVFAQPGGKAVVEHISPMFGKTPIIYSVEDRDTFRQAGFGAERIHLISNRIRPLNTPNWVRASPNEQLTVTLSGNLKPTTMNGVLEFFDLLVRNAEKISTCVEIIIAGKDISEGQTLTGAFVDALNTVNRKLPTCARVTHIDWVEDIDSLYAKSDICIGKGRSVLQPAMAQIISFTLSETGKLTLVNKDTFDSLYSFNFSGRGEQKDHSSDFLALLAGEFPLSELRKAAKDVSQIVKQAFLIEHAKPKLERVYGDAMSSISRGRGDYSTALRRLLSIYWNGIKRRVHAAK